jgi:signal transduction histidine kinase
LKSTGERRALLSTLPAGSGDQRLPIIVVVLSTAIFLAVAPFAKVALTPLPAFLPLYQSALILNDAITAVLLYGQYNVLRSRALLVLAGGYLFSALMAVAHLLSFPGLFAPGGLVSGGPQTTAWLYFLWHAAFPFCVIAYACLKDRGSPVEPFDRHPGAGKTIAGSIAAVVAIAGALAAFTVIGHDAMPAIMQGDRDAPAKIFVATVSWMVSLVAMLVLWRRRTRSRLDLWIMVVMCAWIFDVALAALLNGARYDVGWYAGRVYGLLAASFVLAVLLLENGMLYTRLVQALEGEQRERARAEEKTAELGLLNAELELKVATRTGEVARSLEKVRAAERARSQFMKAVTHELKTPLNSVIGFTELLKDEVPGPLNAKQAGFAADILAAAEHLLALVQGILEMSRIDAAGALITREAVDVGAMLAERVAVRRNSASPRGIKIHLNAAPPVGIARLDPGAMRRMLDVLLDNAVKFNRDGGEVRVDAGLAGTTLEISVSDTGIGVAREDLAKLFTPLEQLDAGVARRHGGLGLGLALARRLAELHGGTIDVESEPGKGSTFTLRLPLEEMP